MQTNSQFHHPSVGFELQDQRYASTRTWQLSSVTPKPPGRPLRSLKLLVGKIKRANSINKNHYHMHPVSHDTKS